MPVPRTSLLPASINALGELVAAEWASQNFDTRRFPEIAANALQRTAIWREIPAADIPGWVASIDWLPHQPDLDSRFGEPPITLFCHPKFYIEALHWTQGTPDIHQHGFCGAFAVWQGSSIHSRYTYHCDRRVNAAMLLGDLRFESAALRRVGDVELIEAGDRLIHATFHLDSPSVTIVVRTHLDVEHQPQYAYYRPHLAIDNDYRDALVERRVQLLRFLHRSHSPEFEVFAETALSRSDVYGSYRLLEFLGSSSDTAAVFERCLRQAIRKHGEDISRLATVLRDKIHEERLRALRVRVTSPDHRLFLALLMNVPSRQEILDLIASSFPAEDPKTLVLRWTSQLCEMGVTGFQLNETNAAIFNHLINGRRGAELARALGDEFDLVQDESEADRLTEHCSRMVDATIFRHLLR